LEIAKFLTLSTPEVAAIVSGRGPLVCAFPINGTRRWFLLEHPPQTWGNANFLAAYLEASLRRQIELFHLFFDHGIHTLMMPLFGPDLLGRGEGYLAMAAAALRRLVEDPIFLDFYQAYGARVRFYGDYRRYLQDTPHAQICELFDRISRETAHNQRCRLLFGVFAHDAAETVAEISVRYFLAHGHAPGKRALVELYYGEEVSPVDLFIGYDRFSAFDMPLVATGSEDLYFTASPSPYLSDRQLRCILYDHLYARQSAEPDYESLPEGAVERMRAFYQANQGHTQGVGTVRDGFWYPLPQVTLPPGFEE
jgi:tuberculosinol/isotuberculosinol synthase